VLRHQSRSRLLRPPAHSPREGCWPSGGGMRASRCATTAPSTSRSTSSTLTTRSRTSASTVTRGSAAGLPNRRHDRDGPVKVQITVRHPRDRAARDGVPAPRLLGGGRIRASPRRGVAGLLDDRIPNASGRLPRRAGLTVRSTRASGRHRVGAHLVSGVLAFIERSAITGVHCCGPADWKLVIQRPRSSRCLSTARSRPRRVARPVLSRRWVPGRRSTDRPSAPRPRCCGASSRSCVQARAGGCDPVKLRTQAMITRLRPRRSRRHPS